MAEDGTWYPEPLKDSCKQLPDKITENTMVCYGFKPDFPTDPTFNKQTENYYYVRDDPEDPIFYSTCYTIKKTRVFENGVCEACEADFVQTATVPKWSYGEQCVSCDNANTVLEE